MDPRRARVGLAPRFHNPFFLPMKTQIISLFYNLGNTTSRYDQLRPTFGQLLFDAVFFSVWKILLEVARESDAKGDGSADKSSDLNAAPSRVLSKLASPATRHNTDKFHAEQSLLSLKGAWV